LFSTLYPSSARPNHGIFVETRLRHLLATGDVVTTVVAPVPWFPFKYELFGQWASLAATPSHERRNGVGVWHPRYPLPPKIGMSIAPILLALGARPTIARLIRDGGEFDLFDAHYYYPDGAAAALLSRWFNKPFVLTARGSDLNLLPNFRIPRAWIRWTERRASASIAVSRGLMDRLIDLGADPERIHVLRNGVDLAAFRPTDRATARAKLGLDDRRWLLSVGNLIESKGHHIAIDALRHLPSDVGLAIVGEGPERNHLTELARDLRLSDRVVLAGLQPHDELIHWYNAAEVLILCSSREGSPNVLLEALACGTPVVATRVSGVPEIVGSPVAGQLIEERTGSAAAFAVQNVLSSVVSRERVREYASAFEWTETTRGQLELFRAVLRSKSIMAAR
jgi:glycosyltransferase involved in cell wall biosynthesis